MITIDWFSDVVCPFCALGLRQLDAAIERTGLEVVIRPRAFELDPASPASFSRSNHELVAAKYQMDVEQVRRFHDRLADEAAELGLVLDFDRVRPGNTFDAHRLTAWASQQGAGLAFARAVQEAYFADGLCPSDHDALLGLVAELGLDEDDAAEVLSGDAFDEEVRREERTAQALKFRGVPTALMNGRVVVNGAQGVDAFAEALEAAIAEG